MPEKKLKVLVSPTLRCNLRCKYCYVEKSAAEDMRLEDFRAFYSWLIPYARRIEASRIELSWFGGEPLMYGAEALEAALALQKEMLTSIGIPLVNRIQSNLTLVDEKICNILKCYFEKTIGGSLEPFGVSRVFTNGDAVASIIEEKIDLLRTHGIWVGIVCTLTKPDMVSPALFFQYFKDRVNAVRVNRAHPSQGVDARLFLGVEEYNHYIIELMDMFIDSARPGFDFTNFTGIARAILLGHHLECVNSKTPEFDIAISGHGIISSCCRRKEIVLGSVHTSSPEDIVATYRKSVKTCHVPAKCKICSYYHSGLCIDSCIGEPEFDCESAICGYKTEYTAKIISHVKELMDKLGIKTFEDEESFRKTRI